MKSIILFYTIENLKKRGKNPHKRFAQEYHAIGRMTSFVRVYYNDAQLSTNKNAK